MNASHLVTWGIGGLALGVAFHWPVLYFQVATPQERRWGWGLLAAIAVWAGVTWGLAASGVLLLTDLRPPPAGLIVVGLLVFWTALLVSPVGRVLSRAPWWWLVGIHGFRLPLELIMHQAAAEGTMPVQMTFGAGGWNYDILTGISALLLGAVLWFRPVPRAVILGWGALGSALLLGIMSIAVASTPLFAAFGPEALNEWVFYPPFVWLPTLLVGSAWLGQGLVFRKAWSDQ